MSEDDIDAGPPDLPPTEQAPAQPSGERRRIGPYVLRQKIGEGGIGEVWLAEQTEPIRRKVGVKIIKQGMDTRQVVARFEAERQALAMMDHPCVAKVFAAGSTPQGRPYFAMEYVRGVPITEYCDRHRLTNHERLKLFQRVCEGVQHAHQKAIIHRDLKPSNVLVEETDGKPVPKIIDFGVAKAIGQKLTERTLYTELGALIGTPEYMSPEQARLTGEDVDTRTDVYSLGVMLYELLVGALPFDPKDLRGAGFDGIRRKICEEDPRPPSTRLSTLGEGSVESARRRRVDLPTLHRQLQGDLDWITMKALEKDRARRYGSPSELSADIERYLDDQPVLARAPSAAYQARKFVRRHRFGVAVAAVAAVLLAAVAVALALQARRIALERDHAEQARSDLESVVEFQARMLSEAAPDEIGRRLMADLRSRVGEARRRKGAPEADVAAAMAAFDAAVEGINSTNAALRLIDEEILGRAAQTILDRFGERPLIEARLRDTIGETYAALGLYQPAEEHLLRAREIRESRLGGEDPETLASLEHLAGLYWHQGRYEEAESLARRSLDVRERILGPSHSDTMVSANVLALIYTSTGRLEQAEELYRDTLEHQRQALGPEHPDTLATMNNLGVLYNDMGRFDAAERQLAATLDLRSRVLGAENRATVSTMINLATSYGQRGRYAEAERLLVRSVEVLTRVLGEEHPDTLSTMNNLALVYARQGRFAESEALDLRTLPLRRRVLGPEHPETLVTMNNLSVAYFASGRREEARRLDEEILAIRRRALGEDHPDTLVSMNNLAFLYESEGRQGEAESLYVDALERRKRVSGFANPDTERVRTNLINLYRAQNRIADLRPLMVEKIEAARLRAEREDAEARDLNDYAWQLLTAEPPELRDPARAVPFAQRACAAEEAGGGPELWNYLDTLALAWHMNGNAAAAVETEKRALALLSPDRPERAALQQQLAEFEAAASGTASRRPE